MDILDFLAEDCNAIPYRKSLNEISGGIIQSIILQQIIYWWKKNKEKPFYKFTDKCNHESYRDGDSWCEEIGCSPHQFRAAIKEMGEKIKKQDLKNPIKSDAIVYYFWTQDRKTYYGINEKQILLKLANLKKLNQENKEIETSKVKKVKTDIYTENTQKNTKEKEPSLSNFQKKEKNEALQAELKKCMAYYLLTFGGQTTSIRMCLDALVSEHPNRYSEIINNLYANLERIKRERDIKESQTKDNFIPSMQTFINFLRSDGWESKYISEIQSPSQGPTIRKTELDLR